MMSSLDITGILDNSKELDRLRKEQEDVLLEINRLHKKLQTAPEVVEKPGDNSLARLKILYTQAKDLSDSEAQISSLLINQLDTLLPSGQGQPRRRIGKEGNEQKRKRVKTESDISRMSNLKGEQVAARVTPRNADKDEWFVVKVIHFDKESKEVEVLDEEPGDDEEGSGQRQYKLPMGNIIPFPKSNDPSGAPDFPPGSHVLAVYPGTTALYKATVVHGHRKRKTDDYVLEFDDDEEDGSLPQRTVPFHKVVALPEGHRQ
ncbi:SAGA-associated factor 29 B [Stylosanthes scabra]|uniref:SAGA-associated factor 29 B n=1 Tax=Stylosanthes scabra TaxID=79078 RepID=A0ABU6UCL5_9FABA|nr:SAGA-associated factor 29 B [Stylosanthes scabra]